MKLDSPLFSIVIPTFEREHHIARCLESLVQQSFWDFEVVVVDNASADQTAQVVTSFEDRLSVTVLINDTNHERSYSRNRGARHANGRFVVFLDSDDELRADSLARAAQYVESNPSCRFFFQRVTIVDESGETVYEPVVACRGGMPRMLAEGNPLSCSGVFVERELFLGYQFEEAVELIGSEDWHCWIRIAVENEPSLCPGGGALLLNHSERTALTEPWERAVKRFAFLAADLLSNPATREYLAPNLGLFRGTQEHYVAVRAAQQSAFRVSVGYFCRALRYHPRLMFTRRTLYLWRLWLGRVFPGRH